MANVSRSSLLLTYKRALSDVTADSRSDRAAFLIGAGVSTLRPTSLPSGHALKEMCVKGIAVGNAFLTALGRRIARTPRFRTTTPEVMFQSIFEVLQDRLMPFFEVLRTSSCNAGHRTLAVLNSSLGQPLVTTNFDSLLEFAGAHQVLHLHGTLNNHSQLVFRVNQVGTGLETSISSTFRNLIENRTLYVMGYSGADRDVIEVLRSSSCARVVWFIHPRDRTNVSELHGSLDIPQPCAFVAVDLAFVFRDLARLFKVPSPRGPRSMPPNFRTALKKWNGTILRAEHWACVARILMVTEDYAGACSVFIKGSKYPSGTLREAWFLNEAANAMKIAGKFSLARSLAERAIAQNTHPIDHGAHAGSLNLVGLCFLEEMKSDPRHAIAYFRRARAAALRSLWDEPIGPNKERIQLFIARIDNNIGLAYQHLNQLAKAIRFYKRSVAMKKELGDLIGLARTSSSISITYYEMKNYRCSLYWRKKASKLLKQYDRKFDEAFLLRRLGEVNCEQGRTARGRKLLNHALQIYRGNPDLQFGVKLTEKQIHECGERKSARRSGP